MDTMYPAFRNVSKWNVGLAKKRPLGLTACVGPVAAGGASLLLAACAMRADLVSDIFVSSIINESLDASRLVMSNPLGTDLPLVSDLRSEERGQFDTMNANLISALSALAGAVIGGVIR